MIGYKCPNLGVKKFKVPVKKSPKYPKKILPILLALAVCSGAAEMTASCASSVTTTSKAAAGPVLKTLLAEGNGDTSKGYFEATSSTLVAAAAGEYNSKFYDLGQLLVRDGLGNTIIALGREG